MPMPPAFARLSLPEMPGLMLLDGRAEPMIDADVIAEVQLSLMPMIDARGRRNAD